MSRIGFATKQFWNALTKYGKVRKALRGYNAIKNTRYRSTRGVDPIRSEEIELGNYDRDRLVSACLEFKRNNPIVSSISRLRKTDVVGKGLVPQANTGSDSLNAEIEERWEEFSKNPEVTGQMDMRELQQQMVDALLFYGDCGLIVLDKQVQLIDGSRIGNPNNSYTSSEKDKYQNGVEVNKVGKPLKYVVGNRVNGSLTDFKEINANDFIHFFKRIRPQQYRGIPELAPIIDTLQDCDEYDGIEMMSAKVSASLSVAVKRQGSYEYELQNRLASDEQDEDGNLETFEPGRFHYLEPDEDISVISANGRPNVDGIQWINYLLRKVGSAVGIPLEFLIMDIGGSSFSASQGVVLQYQQTVESYQNDLIRVMDILYRRWLQQLILDKSISVPNNAKAFSVRWQRPAFRWINRSAQVQADLDYLRAGAMSLDDVTAPFGYTAEDVMVRKAQNISKAKEIAKQYNLESSYDLFNAINTSASANFLDLTAQEKFSEASREDDTATEPLIDKIGVGGVQAIATLVQTFSEGGLTAEQFKVILQSVFGFNEEQANQIAQQNNASTETEEQRVEE